jgi:aminopeptidase
VPDPRLEKLADVVVGYSTEVRPGDVVRIEGNPPTSPVLRELYRATVRAGGHPEAMLMVDEAAEALLDEGADEQVAWVRWTPAGTWSTATCGSCSTALRTRGT